MAMDHSSAVDRALRNDLVGIAEHSPSAAEWRTAMLTTEDMAQHTN